MSRLKGLIDLRKYKPTVFMDTTEVSLDELCNQPRKKLCEIATSISLHEDSALEVLKILMNRKISQTGRVVSISEKQKQKIYQTILETIRNNRPIEIIYTWPLGKSPNPNKCFQSGPDLAEIFGIQRLLDLEFTLRQARPETIYDRNKPAIIINLINEIPALTFIPGITQEYAQEFEKQFQDIIKKCKGQQVIKVWSLNEILWGNDNRKKRWEYFSKIKSKEYWDTIRSNQVSAGKKKVRIAMYTMITFINIFNLPGANSLSAQDFQFIYDYSREDLIKSNTIALFPSKTVEIFYRALIEIATDLAIKYLVVKDAYKNSSFLDEKSQKSITISAIDKNDCIIFHPISHQTIVNPVHGCGVKTKTNGVTVRHLLNIASEHDQKIRQYRIVTDQQNRQILYFQEI